MPWFLAKPQVSSLLLSWQARACDAYFCHPLVLHPVDWDVDWVYEVMGSNARAMDQSM
jgi:hypothetical protein